ncbi:MAG: nickel pincer cofactor biosynthesis protein LarC [Candidatus Heimdallarchaeota archaeon]|nr:nickel pincer cofactor biosynthesis protein LarC [Candidatus Heimdallarchaeota archaeon]
MKPSNVLAIDVALAGCSGDMIFAALLGFMEYRDETVKNLTVTIQKVTKHPIEVKISEKKHHDFHGINLHIDGNMERLEISEIINYIEVLCSELTIDNKYKEFAVDAFNILLEAEKEVHQSEDIHLHELGTYDTLIDIVGVAYLLSNLNIEFIIISPVATGQGIVNTKHGLIHVPSPAVDYILRNSKLISTTGPVGEATTPTGIAILYSLSKQFKISNQTIWDRSSLGFGNSEWNDRGNFLRLRLGHTTTTPSKTSIIETNLDDISGELMGYTLEKLMRFGALDVSYYPIIMKKNRPAYCLRVISKNEQLEFMAEEIMKLTGTLGVRIFDVNRHIGDRNVKQINIDFPEKNNLELRIKSSTYSDKIEFDDLIKFSEELNVSPIRLSHILLELAKNKLKTLGDKE